MKVTSELLAKYHRHECTPEERAAVESWLEADEFEDVDTIIKDNIPGADDTVRDEMWTVFSESLEKSKATPVRFWNSRLFRLSLAASVLLMILAIATIRFLSETAIKVDASETLVENSVTIDKSPGTDAIVYSKRIDFCGLMRIEVKQNIQLVVNSTCQGATGAEIISLRKGESYIAFNHDFAKENELLIVNVRAIDDLPPLVRRQIHLQ